MYQQFETKKEGNQGSIKTVFPNLKFRKIGLFHYEGRVRETCFLNIINAFYIFLRSANGKLGFCIITEPVLTLKSGEREQLISLGLKTTF